MDALFLLIKALEQKHGHGPNSPEHRGGRARKQLVQSLASILSEPYEGATVFPKGKVPPASGVHILVAGSRDNAADYGQVYDATGLWTNEDGKQDIEPAYYVHTGAPVKEVVRMAEQLRKRNKQESVGVVFRGSPEELPPGFEKVHAYRLYGQNGVVEIIDPPRHKMAAIKKLLGGRRVQVTMYSVGVMWVNGEVKKAAKKPQKPRKQTWGLSDYYLKKMIDDLEDPLAGIFKALEGELVWEQELKATCKAFDRNGELVVECGGEEGYA